MVLISETICAGCASYQSYHFRDKFLYRKDVILHKHDEGKVKSLHGKGVLPYGDALLAFFESQADNGFSWRKEYFLVRTTYMSQKIQVSAKQLDKDPL